MKKTLNFNKIPQMEPWFDDKEKQALMDYMDSGGWLTEYKKTEELEKMIGDYTGSKYVVMVSNGTVSLSLALMAYFDKRHDVVIPDYSMIATATSLYLARQTPVFCDVEPETFCMDFGSFLGSMTPSTKAIMLVSINGRYPTTVEPIIEFCKDHNIVVIEDSAQSLGSFHKDRHVGTYGDIGSFSFSMPKILSMGQGGALVTDNKEVYDKIKLLKNFGRKESGVDKHDAMGFNFKFTDLQAVVGLEQIKKLSWRVKRKREIYGIYMDYLQHVKGLTLIDTNLDETTPWMNDIIVEKRSKLMKHLAKYQIGCRPFYPSIHTQKPYKWVSGKFPNADYASKHGLWLPSSCKLTDEEVIYVCEKVKEGLK